MYSNTQKTVLRALAVSSGSLSFIAGSFMVYWFLKMKRKSFRHQLVMLLIMSDFLKATLEIIWPATNLVVTLPDTGALCTSTGFLSNMFIDATDFAILIIAVHTALCIFCPPASNVSSDKAGLYRYRYIAYGSWVAYSVIMPSLAFLNKSTAYTSSVSWCFLPIRPFYWRIALSWGPRYLILLFIFFLYLAIFVYVKKKFNSFRKVFEFSSETELSQVGVSSEHDIAEVLTIHTPMTEHSIPSKSSGFADTGKLDTIVSEHEASQVGTPVFSRPASTRLLSFISSGSQKDLSIENHQAVIRPVRQEVDPLRLERARIVQQLKHLFIFPIFYLLMWIVPFVYHMTQYHDKFVETPVVILAMFSSFIVPLHGFIDTVVYAYNEKPWRTWRYRDPEQPTRPTLSTNSSSQQDQQEKEVSQDTTVSADCMTTKHGSEVDAAEQIRVDRRNSRSTPRQSGVGADWWDIEEHMWEAMDEEEEANETR